MIAFAYQKMLLFKRMDANVKKLKLSYLYEAAVMKIEKRKISLRYLRQMYNNITHIQYKILTIK